MPIDLERFHIGNIDELEEVINQEERRYDESDKADRAEVSKFLRLLRRKRKSLEIKLAKAEADFARVIWLNEDPVDDYEEPNGGSTGVPPMARADRGTAMSTQWTEVSHEGLL